MALLGQQVGETVDVLFPDGERLSLPISSCCLNGCPDAGSRPVLQAESATATVVKDAGDDPDITNGRTMFLRDHWTEFDAVVFIGALGICVRSIAPALKNKYKDPAVVCIDSTGKFVIPVVSGHVGGANDLARSISALIGAEAVVTTQSDNEGLWALDTLDRTYGWQVDATPAMMNRAIFAFVRKLPTALLLEPL